MSYNLSAALLRPRIAVVVIAGLLPIARLIGVAQFDAAKPLGAFPCVKLRHNCADRAAVFRRELPPVTLQRCSERMRPGADYSERDA